MIGFESHFKYISEKMKSKDMRAAEKINMKMVMDQQKFIVI
jgi:hypothetical protein